LIVQDVARGVHSGFPMCCIAFFVLAWNRRNLRGGWDLYERLLDATEPMAGYVRCPVCVLRGRVARAHYCTDACRGKAGARAA